MGRHWRTQPMSRHTLSQQRQQQKTRRQPEHSQPAFRSERKIKTTRTMDQQVQRPPPLCPSLSSARKSNRPVTPHSTTASYSTPLPTTTTTTTTTNRQAFPGKNKRLFKRNLARTCLVTFKCE